MRKVYETADIQKDWRKALLFVKQEYELTEVSFQTWLAPLKIHEINKEDNVVTIMVPSGDMGVSYISRKYAVPLQAALSKNAEQEIRLLFITSEEAKEQERESLRKTAPTLAGSCQSILNADYTFDQFITGPHNSLAYAAAEQIVQNPGAASYNPLYLYGGAGLGKTHLMQAIDNRLVSEKPSLKVVYVPSEVFTNDLINAIRNGQGNMSLMQNFREKYREADVFLIDDIQFIIGKEATQKEFFHTFNILFNQHKQIVISSDRPPRDLEVLDERYRSRRVMGLQTAIIAPDYETRVAILRKMDEPADCHIENDIISYIARNIENNIRTLIGAYKKIQAMKHFSGAKVSLQLAEDCLRDIISPASTEEISPAYIVEIVADHFHIRSEDILGKSRRRNIVFPRQLSMFLSRELTNFSEEAIGAQIGGRDHSTVSHSIERIYDEMKTSAETLKHVEALRKKIGGEAYLYCLLIIV